MILKAIKKIIPKIILEKRGKYLNWLFKRKLLAYLKKDLVRGNDNGKRKVYTFLKSNSLSIFPYEFVKKYKPVNIQVYTDSDCEMKYVLHENKCLYFKQNWTENQIKEYYNSLLVEQDIDSPHRYEYENFKVNEDDIVIDVGAAEGIFSLSVVERAKKIYLFETDKSWVPVLKKTFEPWSNKVVIVNKYVSNVNTDNEVCLDDYFSDRAITFLKADIEGAEILLLQGAQKILSNHKPLKIVVCTYHRQNDAEVIDNLLKKHGFYTEFSKGYMIFKFDNYLTEPYLRRGLIRACVS